MMTSPFLKSVTLNMKIKSISNKSVDPENFVCPSLARSQGLIIHHLILTLSKMLLSCCSLSLTNWRVFHWQLCDLISNANRINVSCNPSLHFSAKEKSGILIIPLYPNVNSSLSKFLKPEILESDNKWYLETVYREYQENFHHWFGFCFNDPA